MSESTPTQSHHLRLASPVLDRRSGERPAFSDEQNAAIRARGPLITVSAGAGSGKTTVLVERFIDLVQRDGVSPLDILAITFTEKGAAEMKERIVRRFEDRADVRNRRQAEAAYISTIHGFCSRILRENPLAARLDPSFRVMDEVTRNVFLDEHLERLYTDDWYVEHERLFTKRWDSDRPRLFELIVEAAFLPAEFGTVAETEEGLTLEQHVANAVKRVQEHWDSIWTSACNRLLDDAELIRSAAPTGPKHAQLHEELCAVIDQLRAGPQRSASLAKRFVSTTSFTGSVRDRDLADAIKAVFAVVRPKFAACADVDLEAAERREREIFAPIKVAIYAHAAALRKHYDEFKRDHGFLDFEDMQRRALSVLDDDGVRNAYSRRFKHVLLDEAQDTNDVQMRLIDRLRGENQSLFAVGDVKQSIYGFRGANVDLLRERAKSAGAGALSLVDNYRSRTGVIDVVNEVGRKLWSDGSIEFEPLTAKFAYEPHGSDPRVEVWFVEQPSILGEDGKEKIEPADDVREREGVALADWIRATVDGDRPLTIYDRDTRSYRRARYGDIAILSNTRTPFPAYERALADLGIPFVKDGGREFFSGREVRDLLAALRVIENPLDDMSLLSVLRSPLFGWGDRDLVRLRVAAGAQPLWYGMRGLTPNESTAAVDAYNVLQHLRRQANFVPPVGLIELACDVTAYRAALLCLPRGRAQVANIDKLIEFARVTATLDGPSLASFLHRAGLAERYLGRETDAPASSAGDDAVVLSTIHGAKGLEWPIVMLAGLDADFARTDVTSRYSAPDGALILQIKPEDGVIVRSDANDALNARAKARDEAEARRLFYVAMTRSRERLIMSSRFEFESKLTRPGLTIPIKWLAAELGVSAREEESRSATLGGSRVHVEFFSPDRIAPLRVRASTLHDDKLAAARQAVRAGEPVSWDVATAGEDSEIAAVVSRALADSAPAWSAQRALALTTVTQLVYFFRCPLVYYFDLVLQVDEHPRGRGKAAAAGAKRMSALERGTLVHELLERADLTSPPDAEAERLVGQLTAVEPNERSQISAMLGNVLGDPLLGRARSATRLEREYPFYLEIGGSTVQGVIDLVFRDADGRGVVVDYKSNDLAAPGRLATLTELYRPQIELYALAARRAGLVEPTEGTLYFLNKAQAVTMPLDARKLDAVEAQASETLGRIARGAWDTQPGEKCRSCGYRKRGYCEVGKAFEE